MFDHRRVQWIPIYDRKFKARNSPNRLTHIYDYLWVYGTMFVEHPVFWGPNDPHSYHEMEGQGPICKKKMTLNLCQLSDVMFHLKFQEYPRDSSSLLADRRHFLKNRVSLGRNKTSFHSSVKNLIYHLHSSAHMHWRIKVPPTSKIS